MATYINNTWTPYQMITVYTRVLNGLPVRVEAETTTDRYGDLCVGDVQVYWTKKSKNPLKPFTRALIIESKMTENDWDMVENDVMDVALGHAF